MAQDQFQYDKMIEQALRGVVREALIRVGRDGLPGEHHFYIGFATRDAGVEIPAHLLAKFPDEMTIVLQHQFWDLEIGDDGFAVTLSFQRNPERLSVPFAAITNFADPSVNFSLEFASQATEPAGAEAAPPTALPIPNGPKSDEPKQERPASGEVVALDSFRKR